MNDEQPRLSLKVLDTRYKELQAQVDALADIEAAEDGSQGFEERVAAIEAKLEAIVPSTGLIVPTQIDMDALVAELQNRFGSQLRAPA